MFACQNVDTSRATTQHRRKARWMRSMDAECMCSCHTQRKVSKNLNRFVFNRLFVLYSSLLFRKCVFVCVCMCSWQQLLSNTLLFIITRNFCAMSSFIFGLWMRVSFRSLYICLKIFYSRFQKRSEESTYLCCCDFLWMIKKYVIMGRKNWDFQFYLMVSIFRWRWCL